MSTFRHVRPVSTTQRKPGQLGLLPLDPCILLLHNTRWLALWTVAPTIDVPDPHDGNNTIVPAAQRNRMVRSRTRILQYVREIRPLHAEKVNKWLADHPLSGTNTMSSNVP